MPRRIINPIREGMPSKIYYLLYSKCIHGYKIAKNYYQIYKNPPTSKIYNILHKYPNCFERTDEDCWQSKPGPLLDEIEECLREQKVSLIDEETKILMQVLDSDSFRTFVGDVNLKVNRYSDLDAATNLMMNLSVYATSLYVTKILFFNNENEFDDENSDMNEFQKNWDMLENVSGNEKLDGTDITVDDILSSAYDNMILLTEKLVPEWEVEMEERLSQRKDDYPITAPLAAIPLGLLRKLIQISPFGLLFISQHIEIMGLWKAMEKIFCQDSPAKNK